MSGPGRRWVTRAVLLVVVAVPTTVVVAAATVAPSGATVRRDDGGGGNNGNYGSPILECSYHDTKTGKYNTLWGYSNNTGQAVQLPVGSYNHFSSPAANAGQPTNFLPGRHDNVFIVTSTGSSSWTLGFTTVTAPGKACATNPVPFLPKGVPAWLTIGGLMVVIFAGGLIAQRRVARAATV